MNPEPSQHYVLNLSGHVLFLYAAAVAIFYAVMIGNVRMMEGRPAAHDRRTGWAAAFIFLITLGSNLIGAATVALLSNVFAIPSRQSMVAAPLLLLLERHIRLAIASPKDRRNHAFALVGAAVGMLAGASAFLLADAPQETIKRALIPGDVVTMPVADALENPSNWSISIQLVVFYCVALAIFEFVHLYLKRSSKSMSGGLREGRYRETGIAMAAAVVLNFLGVGALVLLGRSVHVQIRQAMVLLPLFVIMEAYMRLLRADAVNRRAHVTGLAGSALGLAGAGLLFLRHAPIH